MPREGHEAQSDNPLTQSSPLFWLTLAAAGGIILLGARFLIAPKIASEGFGVPLDGGNGMAFAYAKGIRDIFSGVVGLPFLFRGQRRAVFWVMLLATMVPITDGLIVMRFGGVRFLFLSMHWGAALYMIVVTVFLFRSSQRIGA